MKEERIKKLNKELKYLVKEEREKEILKYDAALNNEKIDVKKIAETIYKSRGILYSELDRGLINNISNIINDLKSAFNGKDKKIRNKMIFEIVYMILLLILMKLPFNLVRDIGYEFISILTTNHILEIIWNLAFWLLYLITFVCTLIALLRNFNRKYNN